MRQRLVAVPRALSGWLWLFQDLSDRLTTLDVLLHEIEDDTSEAAALAGAARRRWAASPPGSMRGGWSCVRWRRSSPASTAATTCPTLGTLEAAADLVARIERLEHQLDTLIDDTDFAFLFEPTRRLFSIGFNVTDGRLDQSHYDTLASEARLASFLAIAIGQVPQDHWFRLGRAQAPAGTGRVLLSWSASMFEYLMPLLVMRSDPGTLIHETCLSVVQEQIDYSERFSVPWGISESAYNARDLDGNYQYKAFGVPGLGLKRGLGEDLVVAPYASMLAASLRPRELIANLDALDAEGLWSSYGYYDAVDYTGSAPACRHARGGRGDRDGAPPGHDAGGARQLPQRPGHAPPLPSRSAHPCRGAAAARAGPGAGAAVAAAGRADQRHPHAPHVADAGRAPLHDAAHGGAAHASAVQRHVRRHGDQCRRRLQHVPRPGADTVARGSHDRRLGPVLLRPRSSIRRRVVDDLSAHAGRARRLRGRLRPGPRDRPAPRRHHRRPHGDRRVAGRRRRAAPRVGDQSRHDRARDRADQLRRGGAGARRRRPRAPGLRQPVRRDDTAARSRRDSLHAPAPRRRAAPVSRARACVTRPCRWRRRVRDRPRAVPRAPGPGRHAAGAAIPRSRCRAPAAPCWIPSSACASACGCPPGATARLSFVTGYADSEEQARALIEKYHDRQAVARGARSRRRPQPGRAAAPQPRRSPGQRDSAAGLAPALCRPAASTGRRDRAQPAVARRAVAVWHLRRPADPAGRHRPGRRSRSGARGPQGARVLPPEGLRLRPGAPQRVRQRLSPGGAGPDWRAHRGQPVGKLARHSPPACSCGGPTR